MKHHTPVHIVISMNNTKSIYLKLRLLIGPQLTKDIQNPERSVFSFAYRCSLLKDTRKEPSFLRRSDTTDGIFCEC
jgi:hypothetical protein